MKLKLFYTLLLLLVIQTVGYTATYYSRQSGNFGTAGSWSTSPSGSPTNSTALTNADSFIIQSGHTITVAADRIVANITVNTGGVLSVGGVDFTVNGTTTISGTLTHTTLTIFTVKTYVGLVTINSGGNWNNAGDTSINFRGGISNSGIFTAGAGTYTFNTNNQALTGNLTIPSVTVTGVILTNNGVLTVATGLAGTGTFNNVGTLNYGGSGAIAPTLTATASGNTVAYNGLAQTVKPTTYNNLTLSNSGTKTITTASTTVNGTLSMEGAAIASAAPTYGANAILRYNTATPRPAGPEWVAEFPFANSNSNTVAGGIVIANTGAITLNGDKITGRNIPITINSGATLITNNRKLTLRGNFTNSGTFNAGSSTIEFTGLATTQTISGFTTTGNVFFFKGAGAVNLTGPVNAAGLTMYAGNGEVPTTPTPTLNLGAYTYTFSGNWNRLVGTLNANASTLRIGGDVINSGSVFNAGTGTVEFYGAGVQNLGPGSITYNNLTISGSGTKTLGATTTVDGNLTVNANTTFALSTYGLTAKGFTYLESGTTLGSKITGSGTSLDPNSNLFLEGNVTLSISGTGANGAEISCPVRLIGSRVFTIANGNAADDLLISGAIGGNGSAGINKQGSGTMTLTGANTYGGENVISTGVLQLGATAVISNTAPVNMNGGTLSTFSSTTVYKEDVGPLTLSANSTIALGTGNHSLVFKNSSSATNWVAGAILTITGWTGTAGQSGTAGKVFVRDENNINGLTVDHLKQIRFDIAGTFYPASFIANGEVVPSLIITTGTITGSPFCAGSSVSVPFTVNGSFNSGNTFTAQLSNASGSFASPVTIGTVAGTSSGTVSATIPTTTVAGTGYRIRVIASNPSTTGTDNGTDVTINFTAAPTAVATQPNCATPTGSVAFSGLPGSGTLNQTGQATASYPITQATTTISGLAPGTYNFTVTSGGCTSVATQVVLNAVVIGTKTWDGTAWSGGTPPTINDHVDFDGAYDSGINGGSVSACSCHIANSSEATVIFRSGHTFTVANRVQIEQIVFGTGSLGSLTFENNASLVQINDVDNVGEITYKRNAVNMYKYDYTFWSSPVKGQNLQAFSPNTVSDGFQKYPNSVWTFVPSTQNMDPGIGVAVMAPADFSLTTAAPFEGVFKGVPNNGRIAVNVPGTWRLTGNPYPSAISVSEFMKENPNVFATFYFWTHSTRPSGDYDGDYDNNYNSADYAIYNGTGGTVAEPGDEPVESIEYISAGQAFIVYGWTTNPMVYTNAMRVPGNNTQFTKMSATNKTEKNRLWLKLTNTEGLFKQILVGYVAGATNDFDGAYDAVGLNSNKYANFYSRNSGSNFTIQGRALPFNVNDEVPLGYSLALKKPNSPSNTFSISVDHVDGSLTNQDIFLEDKTAKIVWDLRKGPYTFTSTDGTFNDRFVLKYVNTSLGIDDIEKDANTVTVSVNNKIIKVSASQERIDKVMVYDLSGKNLYTKDVNDSHVEIINVKALQQVLIVKVVLENGKVINQKIIIQ